MGVEQVNHALRVGIARVDELTSLLLTLERDVGEAALQTRVKGVDATHKGVGLLTVLQLVLIAHLKNGLLCGAATVLDGLDNVAVAHVDGIDDAFRREADLTADVLDCALHAANGGVEGVEVAVEVARKMTDSRIVPLYSVHEQTAILIVGELAADSRKLVLYLDVLLTLPVAPLVAEEAVGKHHPHQINNIPLRACRFRTFSPCFQGVQTISYNFRCPRTSPPLGSYSTRFFGFTLCFR